MAAAQGEPPRFVGKKLELAERTFAGAPCASCTQPWTPGQARARLHQPRLPRPRKLPYTKRQRSPVVSARHWEPCMNGSQRVQPSSDPARRSQILLAGQRLPVRLSPTVTDTPKFPDTEEVTGSNPVRPTIFENLSHVGSQNGSRRGARIGGNRPLRPPGCASVRVLTAVVTGWSGAGSAFSATTLSLCLTVFALHSRRSTTVCVTCSLLARAQPFLPNSVS
jgi:hypothetical protein